MGGERQLEVSGADSVPERNEDEGSLFPLRNREDFPLKGVKVVVIHMKDKLNDGPPIGETILEQLLEYEKEAQLGCEFIISKMGMPVYL